MNTGKTSQSKSSDNQFDPWVIWVTFRRCWPWAVPFGAILAAVTAFAVLKTFTPKYRASHLLKANPDYVVFQGVMPTVSDLARSERLLLLNPQVIDPVLADPEIRQAPSLQAPDTAEFKLRQNLRVQSGGTPTQMIVSYEDSSREAAAMVCNAIVESYKRQRDTIDAARMMNLELWLQPEIQKWEGVVEESQLEVTRLSKQINGVTPGQPLDAIESKNSESLMTQLRAEIVELSVKLAVQDAMRSVDEKDSAVSLGPEQPIAPFVAPKLDIKRVKPTREQIARIMESDPTVKEADLMYRKYQAIVLDLEAKDLVRVRRDYYQEMKGKRDQLEKSLHATRVEAVKRAAAYLNKKADDDFERRKQEGARQIAALKAEHESKQRTAQLDHKRTIDIEKAMKDQERSALVARLKVLEEQYDNERQRMEQFGGDISELQFEQGELAVASEVLKKLRGRVAQIQTERRNDGAVRTIAKATPPKNPVETVPIKKMAVAATGRILRSIFARLVLGDESPASHRHCFGREEL